MVPGHAAADTMGRQNCDTGHILTAVYTGTPGTSAAGRDFFPLLFLRKTKRKFLFLFFSVLFVRALSSQLQARIKSGC